MLLLPDKIAEVLNFWQLEYWNNRSLDSVFLLFQKRREEMERLEKEKQADIRSYKGLMVQEKMTSNKQIASGSKTLQELEEDFMWEGGHDKCRAEDFLELLLSKTEGVSQACEILDLNDSWAGHGLLLSPLAVVVYVNLFTCWKNNSACSNCGWCSGLLFIKLKW